MSETKAPTGKQIDALIERYADRKAAADEAAVEAKARADKADELKAELTAMVEAFGARHTEKSKKLQGQRHSATTTTGTLVKVDATKVDEFREFLGDIAEPGAVEQFFSERVTYQLVDGPSDVLKRLTWPAKIRNKAAKLLGVCFTITTKNPSLKIDVAEAA